MTDSEITEITTQLGASQIQNLFHVALRESKDLASESDNFLSDLLANNKYKREAFHQATSAIYREIYYRCAKDLEITSKETSLLIHVIRLLNLDDEVVVKLDYEVGLQDCHPHRQK